jgi:hypothetical protein
MHIAKNAHEHTGSAEAVRPSLRNGFTAYNALSPVIELVCHRCQRDAKHHRHVTPASGVRTTRLRRPHQRRSSTRQKRATTLSRPPHPTLNVRDDRDTPLIGRGTIGNTQVICAAKIFANRAGQGNRKAARRANQQAIAGRKNSPRDPSSIGATRSAVILRCASSSTRLEGWPQAPCAAHILRGSPRGSHLRMTARLLRTGRAQHRHLAQLIPQQLRRWASTQSS